MNSPIENTFDIQNASVLSKISAITYDKSPSLNGWKIEVIEPSPNPDDILALILTNDTDRVIAFRGTKDIKNWMIDVDCKFIKEYDSKVHKGFSTALDTIQAKILSSIFSLEAKKLRLWITGHSLGGALAALFAWRFVMTYHYQPFSGVYTFGQPRVGNWNFRNDYNSLTDLCSHTFRIIHSADIVPHVPFLFGLFRHNKHEIFFNDLRVWKEDAPLLWKLKGEIQATFNLMLKLHPAWLDDHYISNYESLFDKIKDTIKDTIEEKKVEKVEKGM